ncbi:hypothetical protein GCM10009823_18740 [Brevibacterium salitolerans]|uniref:Uncharacterized protein n=1 Tax=Brevibacterium salitolerans TaxID=1403566 RepID=A0ABP5IG79_9MICO
MWAAERIYGAGSPGAPRRETCTISCHQADLQAALLLALMKLSRQIDRRAGATIAAVTGGAAQLVTVITGPAAEAWDAGGTAVATGSSSRKTRLRLNVSETCGWMSTKRREVRPAHRSRLRLP